MELELLHKIMTTRFRVFQVIVSAVFFIASMSVIYMDELKESMSPPFFSFLKITVIIGLISFALLQTIKYFPKYWTKRAGSIAFKDNTVILSHNDRNQQIRYAYKQIQGIEIHKQEGSYWSLRYPLYKLTLKTEDLEESFLFLLRNEQIKKNLISALEQLYKSGVNIREYDTYGRRAFLFKSNLKFKDVQKVKQEYQISW